MKPTKTERGFYRLDFPAYAPKPDEDKTPRLVQESSAIGDYDDSFDRPGSSFLWVGEHHHLNRGEVSDLIGLLNQWLNTGRLSP